MNCEVLARQLWHDVAVISAQPWYTPKALPHSITGALLPPAGPAPGPWHHPPCLPCPHALQAAVCTQGMRTWENCHTHLSRCMRARHITFYKARQWIDVLDRYEHREHICYSLKQSVNNMTRLEVLELGWCIHCIDERVKRTPNNYSLPDDNSSPVYFYAQPLGDVVFLSWNHKWQTNDSRKWIKSNYKCSFAFSTRQAPD